VVIDVEGGISDFRTIEVMALSPKRWIIGIVCNY
jgi:hypothetical protein